MELSFSLRAVGFLAFFTGAVGSACSATNNEAQSSLWTRESDSVALDSARSTVDFADLREAHSSQPIVRSISEASDGSATTTLSYYTLIGETTLSLSLHSTDGSSESVELPRGGSLVLVDTEGSWEATGGTVQVRTNSERLTLVLDNIRLTSEAIREPREGLSGVIVGDTEDQCFVRIASDRPELAGEDAGRVEELAMDPDWSSTFCASQRPDTL